MRKRFLIIPMIGLLSVALVPTVHAEDGDMNNRIHGGMTFSHPLGDPKIDVRGTRERIEIDNDNGWYADYERMLAANLGLKFGVDWQQYDLDFSRGGKLGAIKQTPLTANLLFHPAPKSMFDFYVGGGFAYVRYNNVRVDSSLGGGSVSVDDDKTWDAELGLDIMFGDSHFGLNIDGKYIKTSASTDVGDFKIDPLIGSAGLAIRW